MPRNRKLGRPTAHRNAMLRGMVTYLIENGSIETTITRAKEAVVIVGMQRYLNAMVDNNEAAHRYSGLAERLQGLIEPAEEEMVTFPEDMLPQEALYEED